MSANTSSAVMANRIEPHTSLDDFPTPPWGTRALCEFAIKPDISMSVWEPACNRGYMARPLSEYFSNVATSDICDYGWTGQIVTSDFLIKGVEHPLYKARGIDWIITNPPFRLASQFYHRCMDLTPRQGFALLVRTQFLEGVSRFNEIFKDIPPTEIWQFSERLPMVKGRVDSKVSTASSYCWIVRRQNHSGTAMYWIPPCRKMLEFKDDYDAQPGNIGGFR